MINHFSDGTSERFVCGKVRDASFVSGYAMSAKDCPVCVTYVIARLAEDDEFEESECFVIA